MKALVYYGSRDMRLLELENPVSSDDEVLLRVKACGICGSDVHGYMGITGRRIPPMIMGHEFTGIAQVTGKKTFRVKPGDRVVVQPVIFCGQCRFCAEGLTNMCTNKRFLGVMDTDGAMREYLCVPEKLVYILPDSLSFIQGAMVEPLAVALRAVKKLPPLSGRNLLIIGAGTRGLLVLQLARLQDPDKIIVSDLSSFRLAIAKTLGADVVINPSCDCIESIIMRETQGKGADAAIEAVGVSATVQQAMSCLTNGGTCVWIGNSAKIIQLDMQEAVTRELNVKGTYIYTAGEFKDAMDILSSGLVSTEPVITEITSIEEGVETFLKLSEGAEEMIKVVMTI